MLAVKKIDIQPLICSILIVTNESNCNFCYCYFCATYIPFRADRPLQLETLLNFISIIVREFFTKHPK